MRIHQATYFVVALLGAAGTTAANNAGSNTMTALRSSAELSVGTSTEDKAMPHTISVSGVGKVSAPPNVADVRLGVVTQAKTAQDALSSNSEKMVALQKVLKERGIASKDVQTSGINVTPQYTQPRPRNPNDTAGEFVPKIVGYEVRNVVTVTARDLAKVGDLLDAVVSAGANQIHGITFHIDEPEALLDVARKKAMADAKKKAELIAGEAGVVVGWPITIQDSSTPPAPRNNAMMGVAAMRGASVPIAEGEQELSVTVYVVYELKLPAK